MIFDLATGRQIEEATARRQPPPYRPDEGPSHGELPKLTAVPRRALRCTRVFLLNQLGIADREERVQAIESVLELPRSVGHFVRVPKQDELPPGPLATAAARRRSFCSSAWPRRKNCGQQPEQEDRGPRRTFDEDRVWVLTLADKLRRLFDYDFPGVRDLRTSPVWAAGELLQFGGDFNNYVTSKGLQKQEGVDLPALAANDPAVGRVHAAFPARREPKPIGRASWKTLPRG